MKILFVVTHLLGSGHLSRTLTLARAFQAAGHSVTVASGGMPAPHLNDEGVPLVQISPLQSDGVDFTRLLDATGAVAGARYLSDRQVQLCNVVYDTEPDVLITELFPFGRRVLREEFEALLKAKKSLPGTSLIFSSIRDILAPPSKPSKADFALKTIRTFYDGILVHSDRDVTPLGLSWPVDGLEPYLYYTGFVAPPAAEPHPALDGKGEILVSAGGGDVGSALFAFALQAAHQEPERRWRLLLGGAHAIERCRDILNDAPANLTAEPARRDFRQMLYHAATSVSMCGYNTAQDILQSGCPAVFVPFEAGQEVEQTLRATALSALNQVEVLPASKLTPTALLACIKHVQSGPARVARATSDGAAVTVGVVEKMLRSAI